MDEHTLAVLEYERLLELLAGHARSEPGESCCRSVRPDLDPEGMRLRWRLIDEAKAFCDRSSPPPLEELPFLADVLDRLHVDGLVLRTRELLLVLRAARASRLVRSALRHDAQPAPLIFEMAGDLPVFVELEQTFERCLGPDGEVLDTASPELGAIRRELSGLRGAIQNRLTGLMRTNDFQPVVQDQIVTRRGGRYVIPVRSSNRRQVPGLVHDFSASGATAYVEPLEVVEDNSRLNLLRRREKQEIDRILMRLSKMAAAVAEDLAGAEERLAEIDFLFASADLSRRLRARTPDYDDRGGLELREARHPLMMVRLAEAGRTTIPVDLRLSAENRVLVLSGINAGGKTVALKTLGLLVLMARSGLHLPVAEGSRLGFFDRVMAVIGDDQDLESDLSTFSGHVARLSSVLDQAHETALVLLDELGTGTDPAEGAALALAVLDQLKEAGAWVVTATHYHLLKAWAHLTPGSFNAAVRTAPDGRPLFGLEYGAPGLSAGLAMARGLGLDPAVVDRAETYLDEGHKKTLDLMQRLEEERAAWEASRAENEALREELAQALARLRNREKDREAAFVVEIESLKDRVSQALARADMEFKEVGRRLSRQARPRGKPVGEFRKVRERLREAVKFPPRSVGRIKQVRVGDTVLVVSLGREGRIEKAHPVKNLVEVEVGGMKVLTRQDDLAPSRGPVRKAEAHPMVSHSDFSPPPNELNLLGMTVDEALPRIDKSLDQALLGGLKTFNIIHGIGTGRLKQAVRGYLHDDHRVLSFRPGERRLGGEGVTVVEIRD